MIEKNNIQRLISANRCLTSIIKTVLLVVFVAFLAACSSGGGEDNDTPNKLSKPGKDALLVMSIGDSIALDAKIDDAQINESTIFTWTIVEKPDNSTFEFVNANELNPNFTSDKVGTYKFSVTINNGDNVSEPTIITVLVIDESSISEITAIINGGSIQIDADVDTSLVDENTTFIWTIDEIPEGSTFSLDDINILNPSFTPDKVGTYKFTLVLNNGENSTAYKAQVTVEELDSITLTANAGENRNVEVNKSVTLNGSSNISGGVQFQWELQSPEGGTASLSDPSIANPSFTPDLAGDYVLSLIVNIGELSSEADEVIISAFDITENTPPTANAGAARTVNAGTEVTLDGSGSSDPEQTTLKYTWAIESEPDGSNITLSLATTANPRFTPTVGGAYVFSLIVHDGFAASQQATVTITVRQNNATPVANATVDVEDVLIGETVNLDGSNSTDGDDDSLNYLWTVEKPNSSNSNLSSTTAEKPTFTPDVEGTYTFTLIVNDSFVDSAPDTVVINASIPNEKPTADAGGDINTLTNTKVTLNGSGNDPDNSGTLLYTWTQTAGTTVNLASRTTASPSFTPTVAGTYEFSLIVNDGLDDSLPASVKVFVTKVNTAPVANAGFNRTVSINSVVTLDGTGSSDIDAGEQATLTYSWTLSGKPENSDAELNNPTSKTPQFTADKAGVYVFSLVVKDVNDAPSQADTVTITATNLPPITNAGQNKFIKINEITVLDASSSYDPENGKEGLTYEWSVPNVPAGGNYTLPNPNSETTEFSADTVGQYDIVLKISDGNTASEDTILVTVIGEEGYQGEKEAPFVLNFSDPFSSPGYVDRVSSYYKVDGLTEDTNYHVSLTGLNTNVDLIIYSDSDFSNVVCESRNSFTRHENCTATIANPGDSLFIEVNGALAEWIAWYNINITATLNEGSDTPVQLALSAPHLGTLETISYYEVKNFNASKYHAVSVKDVTGNLKVEVARLSGFGSSPACRETSINNKNVICNVAPLATRTSLNIRVKHYPESPPIVPKAFEIEVVQGRSYPSLGNSSSPIEIIYEGDGPMIFPTSETLGQNTVDTNTSYYQINDLEVGAEYDFLLTNFTDNVYLEIKDTDGAVLSQNNFPKQLTFIAPTESVFVLIHGDETAIGSEFGFTFNSSTGPASSEGTTSEPITLDYNADPAELPHTGSVGTSISYYEITNVPTNEKINFAIRNVSDDADLYLYSDSSFTTEICKSDRLGLAGDLCSIQPTQSTYYIRVDGSKTWKGAFYNLTVAPPQYPSQGSSETPISVEASVAHVGYSGSVDNGDSFYVITGLEAASEYTIRLTNPVDDVDLYIYSDSGFSTEICRSDNWDASIEESCTITAPDTSIYVKVNGFWSVEGATFTLTID